MNARYGNHMETALRGNCQIFSRSGSYFFCMEKELRTNYLVRQPLLIRKIIDEHETDNFVLWNGTRPRIKRQLNACCNAACMQAYILQQYGEIWYESQNTTIYYGAFWYGRYTEHIYSLMMPKKRWRKFVMSSRLKVFNLTQNLAPTKEKLCKVISRYAEKGGQTYYHKNIAKLLKVLRIQQNQAFTEVLATW